MMTDKLRTLEFLGQQRDSRGYIAEIDREMQPLQEASTHRAKIDRVQRAVDRAWRFLNDDLTAAIASPWFDKDSFHDDRINLWESSDLITEEQAMFFRLSK